MGTPDDYFWPTHWSQKPVLRNKLGITDQATLDRFERVLTARAEGRIRAGRIPIERTYDVPHLKAINKVLGEKIYDWAGEFRTVLISKSPSPGRPLQTFMSPGIPLERWMAYVMDKRVRAIDWVSLSRDQVVRHSAELYADANFGHAFRELNGRTLRMFVDHVLEQTNWRTDYTRVSTERWAEASYSTFPPGRPPGFNPSDGLNYEPMRQALDQIIVPRPQADPAGHSGADRESRLTAPPQAVGRPRGALPRALPRAQLPGRGAQR